MRLLNHLPPPLRAWLKKRRTVWRMRRDNRHPETFVEKVRFKMAFDRRPILREVADKVMVRNYVAEVLGEQYLTRVLQVADSPEEINWAQLPREFACKVNHASGGVIVVWEGADKASELPTSQDFPGWLKLRVNPDSFEEERAKQLLRIWLDKDFSFQPGSPFFEWAYQGIPRRILIEERLSSPEGEIPRDIKFFCFSGQIELITVEEIDVDGELKTIAFDPAWARLSPPGYLDGLQPPQNLEAMSHCAELLSAPFDFVRVDMYEVGDRIVFGELTNYPRAGQSNRPANHYYQQIGRAWQPSYSWVRQKLWWLP